MRETSGFDAGRTSKKLLREGRTAALATLTPARGDPYCSLVNIATAADGSPLLLISRLAVHTKNLLADPRCSLMIDERKAGDPLEGARVTLQARAVAADDEASRHRYLARQPGAAMFAGFADFGLYRLEILTAHLVAGFGRIVNLTREQLLTPIDDAGELVAAEAQIVAHMNEDHLETCELYATKLLGAPSGAWRCVGSDPEGLELQLDRTALRLDFPERVTGPTALRAMLKRLAAQARVGDRQG
jgi:heme iron utilization protein